MLCDGANITQQSRSTQNQAQLSICQLIVFNSLLRRKKQTPMTRHNKSREPPLPVYLGVFLHNKTRKRELVDTLYELGLSVSYDRVLEISTDLGTKICKYYDSLNTVCPPQLKKGVFTTSAMDNIYTRVPPVTQGKLSCAAVPSLAMPVTTECPLVAHSVNLEYRYI